MMEQEKYWERFTSSGKIEDYLAYRNNSTGISSTGKTDRDSGEYERNGNSDRNDCSVVSGERVR